MKSYKQYLIEKSVKGQKIDRYLSNPTITEIYNFMQSKKIKQMRCISYNDKIYFWDSLKAIHSDFLAKEFFVSFMDALHLSKSTMIGYFEFDENDHLEAFYFGKILYKKHKKLIDELIIHLGIEKHSLQDYYDMFSI